MAKEEAPKGTGGIGKTTEDGRDEAGGRGKYDHKITCVSCGAINCLEPSWNWYYCWKCGAGPRYQ